jgi:hypothetical protein
LGVCKKLSDTYVAYADAVEYLLEENNFYFEPSDCLETVEKY